MVPVSWLYRFGSEVHRCVRRKPHRPANSDAFIISIGNLEAGGGGKTPFCIHLLRELLDRGGRPAYISRGYGSESGRLGVVTVVPPDEPAVELYDRPGLRFIQQWSPSLAGAVGDEGAVVARAVPAIPLLFAGCKKSALEAAVELFNPTHIILDDAFQSWGVYRDLDIVLLDAKAPLGNGRVLPAGSLREVPAALKRADWIGFNNIGDQHQPAVPEAAWLDEIAPGIPVFGIRRKLYFQEPGGPRLDPDNQPIATLSSIARPEAFDALLRDSGWNVELSIRYPDHHSYRPADLPRIRRYLGEHHIDRLITTQKDWVKLESMKMDIESILLAGLELELSGADLLEAIKKPQAKPAASS